MPLPRHVLVVDRDPQVRFSLPCVSKPRAPSVIANFVTTLPDALKELGQAGHDVVLLRVDEPRDLSLLPRIKESAPATPVIALLPEPDEGLTVLARDTGADDVRFIGRESGTRISRLGRMLESTEDLVRRCRAVREANLALVRQLGESVAKTRRVMERTLSLAKEIAKISWSMVNPLLIDVDRDQILLLKNCFNRIGIETRLPVLRDGQAAIAYLSGGEPYGDRAKYPLPNLVVLDVELLRTSGLEVLAWIRSQPSFSGLVVFLLTSSSLGEHKDRALALGADFYYDKPPGLDDLRVTVERMAVRWALIHRAHQRKG
jgi:DNA-binding response OmpR family regulator